jgi:glycerol-1-phosphate dehydrogenase [NAD(P)+]
VLPQTEDRDDLVLPIGKHAALPLVRIGSGLLARLPEVLSSWNLWGSGRVLVLAGRHAPLAGLSGVSQPRINVLPLVARSVTEDPAAALDLGGDVYDIVVGIGGGGALEQSKQVGYALGLPVVVCPTTLSNDGIISPVGAFRPAGRMQCPPLAAPVGVVVDTQVAVAAPARFARAGVGELLSNLSAVEDWRLAERLRAEPYDGIAGDLARDAANRVLSALPDTQQRELALGLIQAGLAITIAGSTRPCSGACHKISHALDELRPGRASLHGEQVALGACFATWLRGDGGLLARLIGECARRNLPYLPAHIGMDDREFARSLQRAGSFRRERWTVVDEFWSLPAVRGEAAVSAYADAVTVLGPQLRRRRIDTPAELADRP